MEVDKLPVGVRRQVLGYFDTVREVGEFLEQGRRLDLRFGGGGRYESECLLSLIESPSQSGTLFEAVDHLLHFVDIAPGNDVDPLQVFIDIGGLPIIEPSERAVRYLTDDHRFPLPEKVVSYIARLERS